MRVWLLTLLITGTCTTVPPCQLCHGALYMAMLTEARRYYPRMRPGSVCSRICLFMLLSV